MGRMIVLAHFAGEIYVEPRSLRRGPTGRDPHHRQPSSQRCLDRGSRTLLAVQAANRFGVSVLHSGQEEIARSFATKAPVADKWQGVEWADRDGIPAIADPLVWVACELRDVIAGGDHVIVTGEVRGLEAGEGDPLVFHGGEYRPLG